MAGRITNIHGTVIGTCKTLKMVGTTTVVFMRAPLMENSITAGGFLLVEYIKKRTVDSTQSV